MVSLINIYSNTYNNLTLLSFFFFFFLKKKIIINGIFKILTKSSLYYSYVTNIERITKATKPMSTYRRRIG